jgi:hypothetical protein
LLVLMLLAISLAGGTAFAQATQKERAFVYGINAAFATTYLGTFAPASAPAIYLLANQTSVLSPRITEIYFWPITNQYQADWDIVNEPVQGKLEILRGGQLVTTIEATKYSIQFTPRGVSADGQLFLGAEAEQAQAQFKAKQAAYRDASAAYVEANRQWMALVDDAVAKRAAGKEFTPPPPQPQPPTPIDTYSNGLNDGVPIKLEPGNYTMQLRAADGTIVPQSQRDLVVFAPRRVAVGYTVVPETRWTTPDQVTDLSDVILSEPGSNLFLEPHVTREFPQRAYALLQDPQAHGVETSEWTWVSGEPLKVSQMQILAGDQVIDQLALTPYHVKQLAESGLGYEVRPFDPNDSTASPHPDLVAYPIRIDTNAPSYNVRLISPQGSVVEGSARLVRAPSRLPFPVLLLLPAVPLIAGAAVILRRRRRMRLPRDVVK